MGEKERFNMNSLNIVTVSGYIAGEVKTFPAYMNSEGKPTMIAFDLAVPVNKKVNGDWVTEREYYHCIATGEKATKLYNIQTAYLLDKDVDSNTKGTGIMITGSIFTKSNKYVVTKEQNKNKYIPLDKATEKEKNNGITTTFTNLSIWVNTYTLLKRANQSKKIILTGTAKFQNEMESYNKGNLFAVKFNLKVEHYNKKENKWEAFYVPSIAFGEVAKSLQKNIKNNMPICLLGVLTNRKNIKNGIQYKNEGIIINEFSILAEENSVA